MRDAAGEPLWVWREDRIHALPATEDIDVPVVSGCRTNLGQFYAQFDHVILLSVPVPALLERLASRSTNPHGKEPEELARILAHVRSLEPLLRRTASLEVDTSAPVAFVVVERILQTVCGAGRARCGSPSPEADPGGWSLCVTLR